MGKKQRKKIKTKNVILWSLSGSSVHKVYPWTDNVIAALLLSVRRPFYNYSWRSSVSIIRGWLGKRKKSNYEGW